jgi:cytochrome c oxidase assembly protein Cox11
VRERHRTLILLKPGEHFQENILRKVFLGDATREVGTHDADNQRVKMIDQLTRSGLITLTYAHQAASHVERRFFIRHRERKLKPDTARKTGFTAAGYIGPKVIGLKTPALTPAPAARYA